MYNVETHVDNDTLIKLIAKKIRQKCSNGVFLVQFYDSHCN